MPYIGNNQLPFDPSRSLPSQRDVERFSGNGSTTTFTLSRAVNAAVDIEVFVENVQQEPIVAYDVTGPKTIVENSVNGYLIKSEDDIHKAIVKASRLNRVKVSNSVKKYTWENVAKIFIENLTRTTT